MYTHTHTHGRNNESWVGEQRMERGADGRQQKEDDEVGRKSRGDGRHTQYSSFHNAVSKTF